MTKSHNSGKTYFQGTVRYTTKNQINRCAISSAGEPASAFARHEGYATTIKPERFVEDHKEFEIRNLYLVGETDDILPASPPKMQIVGKVKNNDKSH